MAKWAAWRSKPHVATGGGPGTGVARCAICRCTIYKCASGLWNHVPSTMNRGQRRHFIAMLKKAEPKVTNDDNAG